MSETTVLEYVDIITHYLKKINDGDTVVNLNNLSFHAGCVDVLRKANDNVLLDAQLVDLQIKLNELITKESERQEREAAWRAVKEVYLSTLVHLIKSMEEGDF